MIIVYPPTIDFNWMVQRPQQLMKEFAKLGHTVYYCQQHQIKGKRSELIAPNLWLVWDIAKLPKPVDVLWIGNPPLWNQVNDYKARVVVYDCCDDFYAHWGKLEDELTKRADIVVTTAQRIYDRKIVEKGQDKVFLIPNGVDDGHFQYGKEYLVPGDLAIVKKPILGYVGALADWVDWDLVKEVSQKLDWQIVLVGPEFHPVPAEIKKLPNVKLLGLKDYKDLPFYIKYIDVCMIPFKLNSITRATNPIKLYEYLAMGKPVVTTDMDEIRVFSDVVGIAKSADEFVSKVKEEYVKPIEQLRIDRVKEQTWNARARKALEVVQKYDNSRLSGPK